MDLQPEADELQNEEGA